MNKLALKEIANYMYKKYFSDLDQGALITIHDLDSQDAIEFTETLHSLMTRDGIDCDLRVLGKTESGLQIRPDKAVEFRNQGKAFALVIPTKLDGVLGSVHGFTIKKITNEIEKLVEEIMSEQSTKLPKLEKYVIDFVTENLGQESLLEFFVELKNSLNSLEFFASNLYRIGLIPDSSTNVSTETLTRNAKAVKAILSSRYPFRNLAERLSEAGIAPGQFRNHLHKYLLAHDARGFDWIRKIHSESHEYLYFHNWTFQIGHASQLEILKVKSFLKNGKLDKRTKLELNPVTQEFVCRGDIRVEWTWAPNEISEKMFWKIEVRDASPGIAESFMTLRASKNAKSKRLDLRELEEQEGKSLVIRITAVDEEGNSLTLKNGEIAQDDSEDFLLRIDVSEGTNDGAEKKVNAVSLPEAVIKTTLEDKSFTGWSEERFSRYLEEKQMYEILIGGRWARIRSSLYVMNVCKSLQANPREIFAISDHFRNGESRTNPNIEKVRELQIPASLLETRQDFLIELDKESKRQSLNQDSEGSGISIEAIFWSESLCKSLDRYVSDYARQLCAGEEYKDDLLQIDQLSLRIDSPNGTVESTLILPIHPLRALWLREHQLYLRGMTEKLLEINFDQRKKNCDMSLVSRLEPANLPFIIRSDTELRLYVSELLFGTGVYVAPSVEDKAEVLALIYRSLNLPHNLQPKEKSHSRLTKHFVDYSISNRFLPGIKIATVNGGNGGVVASAVDQSLYELRMAEQNPLKIEISAFSNSRPNSEFAAALRDLQLNEYKDSERSHDDLFSPAMSLRIQTIEKFFEQSNFHNISVLHGATSVALDEYRDRKSVGVNSRASLLGGLITYLYTQTVEDRSNIWHLTRPSLDNDTSDLSISSIHYCHQKVIGGSASGVTLKLRIDAEQQEFIKEFHNRSDWVLTIDRFLGLSLYEDILTTSATGIVVLDYAPDFIDGLGDRLTLTTTKFTEISRVIIKGMFNLGLDDWGVRASDVLKGLCGISGRLAMRLMENNSLATETIGLFAAFQDLEKRQLLANAIVIPVDSHQDVFSPKNLDSDRSNDRCDLVIVSYNDEQWFIDLVEVKTRRGKFISDLPFDIARQLSNTQGWIENLLSGGESDRVDLELQWARWISLLHFYADRANLHGRFDEGKIEKLHDSIDNLSANRKSFKIRKTGYIVSLEAEKSQEITRPGEIDHLILLNEADFLDNGWTTLRETKERSIGTMPSIEGKADSPLQSEVIKTEYVVPSRNEAEILSQEESLSEDSEEESEVETLLSDKVIPQPIFKAVSELGKGRGDQVVSWEIETKGSPHGIIVGASGFGKSHTTKKIISDISKAGVPCLVFDFHGEIKKKKIPHYDPISIDISRKGLPFNPFAFKFDTASPVTMACQEISEILGTIGGLGTIQKANVKAALKEAYLAHKITNDYIEENENNYSLLEGLTLPTVEEFATKLGAQSNQRGGMNAALRLGWFTEFNLFRPGEQSKFNPLQPRGYVFDVSRYADETVRVAAGAFILRKLYNDMHSWEQTGEIRVVFILDEAHRLVKDPTIPKLMKEGRKFGVSLLLVSQSLNDFAEPVVANAGLRVSFRVNFPDSRTVAKLLQNRDAGDISKRIESLTLGQAYVATKNSSTAEQVDMFDVFKS